MTNIKILLILFRSGLVAALLLMAASNSGAHAQDNSVYQNQLNKLTPEELMLYLSNEKVVAAGVGFLNGQLNDPMQYILDVWGEPLESRKTGLLGSTEFLYQPDPSTLVVFTGKQTVKAISIKGGSASRLRTRLGARFGFDSLTVTRMYPQQGREVVKNRMEYPLLGINMHFLDNKLSKIVVYNPEN